MMVSPHSFSPSTQGMSFGLVAIQWKVGDKKPFESSRKPMADQLGLSNLIKPSYKKCQPMATRNAMSATSCMYVSFVDFAFIVKSELVIKGVYVEAALIAVAPCQIGEFINASIA